MGLSVIRASMLMGKLRETLRSWWVWQQYPFVLSISSINAAAGTGEVETG